MRLAKDEDAIGSRSGHAARTLSLLVELQTPAALESNLMIPTKMEHIHLLTQKSYILGPIAKK